MEDRTQQSCFYLISFKNSPHFPHEVIGGKQIERYGTKPQTLPSKQKLFILQQIHPTRRIDGTIDTMPTQNKISAHVQPHNYIYSRDEQAVFQSQSIYWVKEKHILNNETGKKDQ